jgi:hypothetical protein
MVWLLGPLLLICGAGGGFLSEQVMGMVVRFQLVARPYEIKTQNEGGVRY